MGMLPGAARLTDEWAAHHHNCGGAYKRCDRVGKPQGYSRTVSVNVSQSIPLRHSVASVSLQLWPTE
jgi:ribosomal protein S14